jgi:hypothetical protein
MLNFFIKNTHLFIIFKNIKILARIKMLMNAQYHAASNES